MGAQEQLEVANRVLNLVFALALLAIIGVPVAIFMFRLSFIAGLIATLALASFAAQLLLPVARALLVEQLSRRK